MQSYEKRNDAHNWIKRTLQNKKKGHITYIVVYGNMNLLEKRNMVAKAIMDKLSIERKKHMVMFALEGDSDNLRVEIWNKGKLLQREVQKIYDFYFTTQFSS